MIEITINNNNYKFEKIITVLQACEQANIIIPRFCYHEKLSVAGSCRMCLVEIEKSPKPVASCAMPISNGMVIFTNTPLVKKAQESVLELLLINHPLDCPICDQGGECDLQDITLNYGADRSRFFELKRGVEDKQCGPIIKTIMTRCIHCTRCVRFLSELTGVETLGSIGRGEHMEIGTYLNKYIKTELSGNLVDLCPVGAITSKPYAFLARNWELKKIESIDFTDALGSNILINTRNNSFVKQYVNNFKKVSNVTDQILRILPKANENINETWISDKTRYNFDSINILRQKNIIISKNLHKEGTWNDFLTTFIIQWKHIFLQNKKNNVFGLLGNILSIEELFIFIQFLKSYGVNNFLFNNKSMYNINIDFPNFYQYNSLLKNIEKSDIVLLIGINPRIEASMLNLKLRKHFFNKNVSVNLIGTFVNLNYPIIHLGNSVKTLINIIEGKNSFCKQLKKAKNPLIIIGSEFCLRADSTLIQNLIRFLSKKNILILNNNIGINFVHSNITQAHFCEIGMALNAKSKSFLIDKKKILINNDLLIANNINDISKNLLINNNFFCSLNTHRFDNDSLFQYKLPINSFYERDSINVNIEGVVQKGFKSKTSLIFARNSEDIFRSIISLDQNLNSKKGYFTKKWLFIEAPFLKKTAVFRKKFNLKFFNLLENSTKAFVSNFKPLINNFYMTDNITKNSKIMAECALFLNNKTNFNKIF